MTLITVLLDTDIQLFFYYCSYSLVGAVSFDMTGQNSNSISQLAFCYIVSPLMMRLMQNVFTCIKLSQQARIWFALESISLSNDRTQFHYIFWDDRVQFKLYNFKLHNTIQAHQFFFLQMDSTQFNLNSCWSLQSKLGLDILPWRNIVRLPHHGLVPSLEASTAITTKKEHQYLKVVIWNMPSETIS